MSILVVGSVALDTVETRFGVKEEALGGAATYFSLAARHFSDVRLVGVVGDDFPRQHVELLEKAGVDTGGLAKKNGPTFRWSGRYHDDMKGRDTLKTELGVFADFKPEISEKWRDTPFVFLANIDPELQIDVLRQVKQPRLAVCDTMDFWIEGKPDALSELLKSVDALVINDEEVLMLGGKSDLLGAAEEVRAMGPDWLVVKRGEYGALLFGDEGHFSAPALLLENVKDPTGAGDTFAGGFMGVVAQARNIDDETLRKAVVMGNVMASFTVEQFSVDGLVGVVKEEIGARYGRLEAQARFPRWDD